MTQYSVSKVKTYLNNPWDYYQSYVLGNKKKAKFQDYLDRGSFFHKFMEELGSGATEEEAMELALSVADDWSDKGIELGKMIVERYKEFNGDFLTNGKVVETELEFNVDISDLFLNGFDAPIITLKGFIDAVVENDFGEYWIVDYKTYSNKPSDFEKEIDFQTWVYMWICNEYLNIPVVGFIYDCIGSKTKYPRNYWRSKKIKIRYKKETCEKIVSQFLTLIERLNTIEETPENFPFVVTEFGSDYELEYQKYTGLKSSMFSIGGIKK